MQFLKIEHSNSLKALENKEKATILQAAVCIGDPNESRTRVTALRGPCPRPLDDGTICFNNGTPLRYLISLRSFQFPRSIRYSEELADKNNNTLLFLLSVPRPLDDGTT